MFTHGDIWRGIDRLAQSRGMSPSGLAKKAGLDPTTFNKSKRTTGSGKSRWPSTESLSKILEATGASLAELVGLIEERQPARSQIPLIGFAEAGQQGFFDDGGFPAGAGWDLVEAPSIDDEHAYALEVSGHSMEPAFGPGDILIVSPGATIRRGDRVVVKTQGGEVMAKELVRQTATKIELKSINPDHENPVLALSDVEWMARILWASQ
ncbi:MAG: helix-turn-helix transcriptional regulator [Alphaproteobacteria bacterium]|nr:helix-turn-helix transcriptional regulator [Alphaproteobacteria bacterium SS10]